MGYLFLNPKLIKNMSVKSLEAEPSWFQPISQGIWEGGWWVLCIRREVTTNQKKSYFKMPDLKKNTPICYNLFM